MCAEVIYSSSSAFLGATSGEIINAPDSIGNLRLSANNCVIVPQAYRSFRVGDGITAA